MPVAETQTRRLSLRMNEKELCAALSVSRSFLWSRISRGEYPKPMKADAGNRWDTATVTAWYDAGMPHFERWAANRSKR